MIDTTTNSIIKTIAVPAGAEGIAIIPPPQGVPFRAFKVAKLDIELRSAARSDSFDLKSEFSLMGTASESIHPDVEPVKLQVGPFIATIPAGSFRKSRVGSYTYEGVIDGVRLEAKIEMTGTLRYAFDAEVRGASLSGTTNPVQVSLGIGDDAGLTSVKAHFDRDRLASRAR